MRRNRLSRIILFSIIIISVFIISGCSSIICSFKSGSEKYWCYEHLAIKTKDESYCFQIIKEGKFYYETDMLGEPLHSWPATNCFYSLAKSKKDGKLCRGIIDLEERDDCLYELVNITQEGLLCKDIKKALFRNSCLVKVGIANLDESFCDTICEQEDCPDEILGPEQYCFDKVAVLKKEISLCPKGSGDGAYCFAQFAVMNNNLSLCKKTLSKPGMLMHCVKLIALINGDPGLCNSLKNEFLAVCEQFHNVYYNRPCDEVFLEEVKKCKEYLSNHKPTENLLETIMYRADFD